MRDRPRSLTSDDVDGFMESRNEAFWDEIEAYLTGELFRSYPFRATRIRKDIKWMRKRAAKAGLEWG